MAGADPYDLLPYTDHAYAESHPDRLSVVARLSSWQPPDLERARVLELGCGRGGNLLPMAASLPGAALVGVDLSQLQIAEARQTAQRAGLDRARFEQADVASFDPRSAPEGPFDFVVCHGVCSWVAPPTRRALLATVGRALAPGGIAYVSFNVLPGWYARLPARDWLRAFPAENARAAVEWLRDAVSPELADYRRGLDAVLSRLGETDRAYARHEYLAEEHHPQPVREMLQEASVAGLAYLGDAIPAETALELLPEAVAARARSLDPASTQQLVDFVRAAAFRRALLVRAVDADARGWRWPSRLDAGAIAGLRIASRLRPHAPARSDASAERFDGPQASVQVAAPSVRRALHELARIAPRSLPFEALAARAAPGDAAELQTELLDLWLATGALDLHAYEPPLGDATSPLPEACPLARLHAARGGAVTNRWHQEVRLDDPVLLRVLGLLDGTRTVDDVAAELRATPGVAALDLEERARLARASVEALASAALLVG